MSTYGLGVATYNDSTLISYFLDSVDLYTDRKNKESKEQLKIVVLDDGSTKDNQNAVRKICENHNVDFICHDKNMGVPKSFNDLVKYLDTDYIILSNNDIILYKNWFESIKFFLENNDNVGTVSLPMIISNREDMKFIIDNLKLNSNKRPIEVIEPCTRVKRNGIFELPELGRQPSRLAWPMCVFGFSRKSFDTVNGFNESYRCFYEEVSFGIELYKKGLYSYVLPGPHIYHVWGATFQTNQHINTSQILEDSKKIFLSKYGIDYKEYFETLNRSFNTTINYLEIDGDNKTQKNAILNTTHFTDWCKDW